MAKYQVTFSCGHTETKELFGKVSERMNKIAYWEKCGICSECYHEQKAIEIEANATKNGEIETVMSFREYKLNYADCKTKPNSYNGINKTIIVYVKSSVSTVVDEKAALAEKASKMTKSDLFKRAHTIAKKMSNQYTDTNYQANFAIALKELYNALKLVIAA